jgi:hypothetical protein
VQLSSTDYRLGDLLLAKGPCDLLSAGAFKYFVEEEAEEGDQKGKRSKHHESRSEIWQFRDAEEDVDTGH